MSVRNFWFYQVYCWNRAKILFPQVRMKSKGKGKIKSAGFKELKFTKNQAENVIFAA